MSGPGQGYHQGHYAQQQPGSGAASPFGAHDGQHAAYNSMDPNAQQGYPGHEHGMNTVYEEDESQMSPELGRNEQHWGGQYAGGGGYGQQQQYDQQHGGYDYSQQQQGYEQSDYAHSVGAGAGQQDSAQPQEQFDVPVYPGWIYNSSTNSYDPDPNYQPVEGGEETEHGQGDTAASTAQREAAYAGYEHGGGQQGYGGYGEQHDERQREGDYGQAPYPQQRQDGGAGDVEEDPYANDPYANDPYASDPYANTNYSQQAYGYDTAQDPFTKPQPETAPQPAGQDAQQDPYAADSNPYEDEGNYDPFGAPSQQQEDPFSTVSQPGEPFPPPSAAAATDPYAPPPQRSQPPPQRSQQQQAYNTYAPSSAPAVSPPPSAPQQLPPAPRNDAYSPPPPQQQYSSLTSAFTEPPAPQAQQPASYDPYAPSTQSRSRSGTQGSSYDPYAPAAHRQQRERSGTQSSAYEPSVVSEGGYSSAPPQQQPHDPYAPQRQSRSQAPMSPPVQHEPFARAPQQQYEELASPPSVHRSAFSPPPRSTSAASNASSRRPPVHQQPAQTQPPPRTSSAASNREQQPAAVAPPPPKATAPPPRVSGAAGAPAGRISAVAGPRAQPPPSSGAAFDIPPPRKPAAPARRAQPPPVAEYAPPQPQKLTRQPAPSAAPEVPSAAPAAAYAPAPAAPNRDSFTAPPQPVLPPSQRKPAPFSSGVLQPPVRRAPHQRGPSAFAGDSPYGAMPSGPLTSMYEAPTEITEEEEEEELNVKEEEDASFEVEKEERPEDVVPSWMQATAAPPQNAPSFYPSKTPEPRQQHPSQPAQALYHAASQPAHDVADELQRLSLHEKPQEQQSPRRAPPPRGGQAPPRGAQAPPPRNGRIPPPQSGKVPPPPGGAAPPPPASALRAQAPPPPRQPPLSTGPPPSRGGPPPRAQQSQAPPPPPQARPAPPQQASARPQVHVPPTPERTRVPQLHFEAPSPRPKAQPSQNDYGYGRSTPQPPSMSGIEETGDEQEDEGEYFGGKHQTPQQMESEQFTTDGSTAYGGAESSQGAEEGTGATTPSSAYGGDWKADSEINQGYDYINHSHHEQHQQPKPFDPYAPSQPARDPYAPSSSSAVPRDPYATPSVAPGPRQNQYAPPQDVPSRGSTSTPPAQQRPPAASGQHYASPSRFGEPGAKPAAPPSASMARANSYGAAAPARTTSTDSYAAYPPQALQGGPYSARADGNLTAPAAYGSFPQSQYAPEQQQHHDQYTAGAHPAPPTLSRQASFVTNGEVADLGLERCTAPVVSFGFGGRMVVVFPRGGQPSYGIDASNPYGAPAGTQAPPSTVHIRKLGDYIPPSSTDGSSSFPGPIFLDGGKANAGKKRKEATAWLSQRIVELEQEVHYTKGATQALTGSPGVAPDNRRKVETQLVLYKLVLVMVENEGRLTGSAKVDDAVRAIFSPDSVPSAENDAALPTADQLATAASHREQPAGSDAPFVTYGVSPANLDQMSAFLLRGERREAVRYALDNRMWAHAFIIASCIDTDCWKDVTIEFLRSELTQGGDASNDGAEGREALRVAYSMFAGLGAESIHQFVPPRALGAQASSLPATSVGNGTPGSAPLSRNATASDDQPLSDATLDKWQDTVGMIVANRTAGDSAALTALGDALGANGWTTAAHICYLLSPQTSLATGLGTPGSRIVLVGSAPFQVDGGLDLESVKLTELVEFAFSLTPTTKGHEPFVGFPHLQAFRLYHAAVLADEGHIPQALKYTEAIVYTLKLATKPSPFYHPRLVAQIKTLSERLGSAPGQKESGSWIARKVSRPTVNSLWSTFEGGFNKFVSGDSEPTPQQLAAKAEVAKVTNGAPVGPFSHYSSISPGSTSGTLSRAQSSSDLAGSNHLQPIAPPVRPLSAAGPSSPRGLAPPPATAAPHHSPGPPPVKRAPYKGHHARSSSLGAFAAYDYNPSAPPPWQAYAPPAAPGGPSASSETAENLSTSSQASHHAEAGARRPQFAAVDDRMQEDESGFISPMAQFTPSVSPAPAAPRNAPQQAQTHRRMTTAEELADLGIGNTKSKKPAFDTLDEELEAEEGGVTPTRDSAKAPAPSAAGEAGPSAPGAAKDADKPAIKPSKSWIGGWFKREASPANQGPGPIKAKLGDEKSLVYDEKLKRWINKNAKGEEDAPAAVVPPPRAATASPSRNMRNGPPRFTSEMPPVPPMPPRSATMGPPPLNRSVTAAELRAHGEYRPPSAAGGLSRPPSAAGTMPPPRSAAATPVEAGAAGRAAGKRKPKHAHIAI
ncbi:hypothetical protein JCM11641_005850 [Rhodosporidiobolus odoratus]